MSETNSRYRVRSAAFAAAMVAVALHAQEPRPQFRAGVDLITVDVVVLNRGGGQVTDLTAADFVVMAGGRPRRLVSAQYVAVKTTPAEPGSAGGAAPLPEASSNAAPPAGRSLLFVIDVNGIRAGEGRAALAGVAQYLDRLDPADRVGLVALPYGTPRVDLTLDRARVREAAGLVAGASQALREPVMTFGEADAIRRGDTRALMAYWDRADGATQPATAIGEGCGPPPMPREEPLRVPQDCARTADRAVDRHRRRTRQLLDSLRALADAMAPLPDPKALVLVSEGTLNDEDTQADLRRFAAAAERGRVSLYSLHLDAPVTEAAVSAAMSDSRTLDDRLGFDGMAGVAASARGTALRVVGAATPLLERIDRETSGYYLLSFERDAADRSRARLGIEVTVNRDGLDVRARREVAGDPAARRDAAASRPMDPKLAMGELLKWPVAVAEVPLDVATFATPPRRGDDAGALVLVAADAGVAPASLAAIGYEIVDAAGRPAADAYDAPPKLRAFGSDRAQYLVAVPLASGRYRLKIGALARDGRRGSVEHAFEVAPWPPSLRASDLMIGDSASGEFLPFAVVPPGVDRFVVRVDLRAESAAALEGTTARIGVELAGSASPAEVVPVPVQPGSGPAHRLVAATLSATAFAPGEYRLTMLVTTSGGEVIRRARRMVIRR